jgi:FixJ family two-component response regulator
MLPQAPTIAILDDEEDYRRALSRLLKAHGYRVIDCSTGAELLAEASRHRIDCVILDLYMPEMSGFDVLAKLQQEPMPPPVIVVTAHDDADTMQRVKGLRAFECRAKPVPAAALLSAIARALHR